jgi:peptidoglycan hydrolase CwlO-like protein
MILMKKSTLASLAFLLLAFVAAFGYFFTEWIYERDYKAGQTNCFMEEEVECPFTQDDIDSLTSEIDRMEDLNKQLSNQLDDYEDLTDRLNVSVEELKRQNEILSESNDQYENLNNQLNDTVAELKEQNQFLADQVDIFAELNKDLNETAGRLEDQVDRLEGEVDDLTAQNDRLEDLVGSLTNETDRLSELTDFLEENVNRLEGNIGSLETENNRLENNIADLRTVISFWDEVTDKSDETYVEMTTFLAQQISTNRLLVLEALQNTYHQRVANWDCALKDQFALEAFANDDNLPIPQDRVNEVLAYVDERVLSELCLDKNDFEEYLEDAYTINDINTNRLVASVQRYTWSAIDYYFPESGESGLAAEDWAAAEYDCGKLPANLNYED